MQQLLMKWVGTPVIPRPLKEGYEFQLFTGTQEEIDDWTELCRVGLLPDSEPHWFYDCMVNHPNLNTKEDIYFAVRKSDGKRIATCAAVTEPNGEGYLHMLGTLTSVRGMGIGHCMIAHGLEMLAARGCTVATLTTDDFRLAAVKTYLDAGMLPVLIDDPESNMRERWDNVIKELNYTKPVKYLEG